MVVQFTGQASRDHKQYVRSRVRNEYLLPWQISAWICNSRRTADKLKKRGQQDQGARPSQNYRSEKDTIRGEVPGDKWGGRKTETV